MKKIITLILALCLLMCSCAFAEFYRYEEPVTLTAYVRYDTNYVEDPAASWLYEFARQEMNIDFKVTGITADALEDFNTTMFASGNLPDVLICWAPLTGKDAQTPYAVDGMILPVSDYISEDVTPNLWNLANEFPDQFYTNQKLSDGKIYMVPSIQTAPEIRFNLGARPVWADTTVFAEAGWDTLPTTTDEFIDALRDIKALKGDDYYPLGGAKNGANWIPWLKHAFGFVVKEDYDRMVAFGGDISDHDITFIASNPNFCALLEYVHTLYAEGLMEPDYFTQDYAQNTAKVASGKYAVACEWNMFSVLADGWQSWEMLSCLTSEYQETSIMSMGPTVSTSGYYYFLTKDCSDPEAAMRFIDVAYDPEYKYLFYYGPENGVDDTYGMTEGWIWNDAKSERILLDVKSGKYTDATTYYHNVTPFGYTGNVFDRRTDGSEVARLDPNTGDGYTKLQTMEKYCKYYVTRYNGCLFDADTTAKLRDFELVLDDHIASETAKFIIGGREINEDTFAEFVDELNALGLQEYIDIQMEAYEEQYK